MTVRAASRKPWNLANAEPLRPIVPIVKLRLPVPPSANALFANRRKAEPGEKPTRGRVKTSSYREWIKEAGTLLLTQRPGQIIGKYELEVLVARSNNKRRNDLDNYAKGISDLLVTHGVIKDDSMCEKITLQWSGETDGIFVVIRGVSSD